MELPDGRNGVVCYFYDLSEHLRMEAAVRDASERIALALDAGAIAGTWVWDVPNDRFTADERFARSFGQDPEACRQGLPLSVVAEPIHPQDWPKTQALLQNALKRGGSYRAEYRVKQSDGSYRWVEAVGRCDLDEKGQPDRFPGVLVDIDARKQDEAALRKSEARLRDLNATLEARVAQRASELEQAQEALRQSQKLESMGQLTGGVAHDFNNLLTPIIGGLDMLQRRSVGDARAQRTIEGALTSAERAKTLVQRLLAFARRQPLQPKAIDVDELIRDMSRLLETTLGPRVSMQLKISENLPLALADANQLEMALLNLVLNARDAMPDGGSLTIAAEPIEVAKNATGYVQLSVRDTGSGMDTETVRRAVEPFFSTKGVGQGTGLGLSMVHGLAAQLGGELSIESTPGKGTTIKLKLKQASEDHRPPEDVAPGAAYVGAGVALLVDDEDLVRASTAEMLAEIGYDVVEASSAEAALKQFQSGLRPSLLITDHLMPGMTGTELAQLARKLQPHLPVLVISGYAEVDGISADLPRLTKPFRHLELEASIAQVVSQ